MNYVLPIAAFLVMFALVARQRRARGQPLWERPRWTPATGLFVAGWALGFAGIVWDDLQPALLPGGLLIVAAGVRLFASEKDVATMFGPQPAWARRTIGAGVVLIGLGWTAGGVVAIA